MASRRTPGVGPCLGRSIRRALAFLPAFGVAALSAAPVIAADNYRTYVNERYGYRIAYPGDFLPQGVPDAGDGQAFVSPAGDAELRVFAGACVDGLNSTPADYLAGYRKEEKAGRLSVTYHRLGRGFAIVSGHRGERVFYDKILIGADWCTQFTFEYDHRQAARYDAVTARIASSLRR